MELTLVVALFILYHLVPVWLGRTVHHVWEAVLLGSMHLLLANVEVTLLMLVGARDLRDGNFGPACSCTSRCW